MRIFLDTANIAEIREMADLGIIDGVTTNPSLMAKAGRADYKEVTQEVCYLVQGPVSAEVISTDAQGMIREALDIAQWSPHVAVKVPFTEAGLRVLKALRGRHPDPETICAGCPWLGKCDTPLETARDLVASRPIQEIRTIFDNYGFETQILTASCRHPMHIVQAAMLGSDVATVPYDVLKKAIRHPLTEAGVKAFTDDWKKVEGQK